MPPTYDGANQGDAMKVSEEDIQQQVSLQSQMVQEQEPIEQMNQAEVAE